MLVWVDYGGHLIIFFLNKLKEKFKTDLESIPKCITSQIQELYYL